MANKKIVGLTAITTQSSTDLSEVSLSGAGSRKETRLQAAYYMSTNPYGLVTSQTSYSTGTASQSGTTITGVGTTWTRGMLGSRFIWPDGTALVIVQVTLETSLVVSASKTQSSTTYNILRSGSNLLGNYWGIPANCYGDMNLQNDLNVMGGLFTSGNDADSFGYALQYNTGTVAQSGTTVTLTGGVFPANVKGGIISFFNTPITYSRAIITERISNTVIIVDTSDTISSTTYQILYGNFNIKGSNVGINALNFYGTATYNNPQIFKDIVSAKNIAITGDISAENGYLDLHLQSLFPSDALAQNSVRQLCTGGGELYWVYQVDGKYRQWSGTLTDNRVFTLPDCSGKVFVSAQVGVTQLTNITTGVTLASSSGNITTVSSTLASQAKTSFTVTAPFYTSANQLVNATISNGTNTGGAPQVWVSALTPGSNTFVINLFNSTTAVDAFNGTLKVQVSIV